jgi:hypothetical protein
VVVPFSRILAVDGVADREERHARRSRHLELPSRLPMRVLRQRHRRSTSRHSWRAQRDHVRHSLRSVPGQRTAALDHADDGREASAAAPRSRPRCHPDLPSEASGRLGPLPRRAVDACEAGWGLGKLACKGRASARRGVRTVASSQSTTVVEVELDRTGLHVVARQADVGLVKLAHAQVVHRRRCGPRTGAGRRRPH